MNIKNLFSHKHKDLCEYKKPINAEQSVTCSEY